MQDSNAKKISRDIRDFLSNLHYKNIASCHIITAQSKRTCTYFDGTYARIIILVSAEMCGLTQHIYKSEIDKYSEHQEDTSNVKIKNLSDKENSCKYNIRAKYSNNNLDSFAIKDSNKRIYYNNIYHNIDCISLHNIRSNDWTKNEEIKICFFKD